MIDSLVVDSLIQIHNTAVLGGALSAIPPAVAFFAVLLVISLFKQATK